MADWHAHGDTLDISVNVSGRQLDHDDIIDDIRDALEASGLAADFLIIEVTETALMRNAADTAVRLQAIKELGVRIAVDDFGTGYSSLAYLQQFPVDCLKIDRAFTNAITTSPESKALIGTLVQLGKDLGLTNTRRRRRDDRRDGSPPRRTTSTRPKASCCRGRSTPRPSRPRSSSPHARPGSPNRHEPAIPRDEGPWRDARRAPRARRSLPAAGSHHPVLQCVVGCLVQQRAGTRDRPPIGRVPVRRRTRRPRRTAHPPRPRQSGPRRRSRSAKLPTHPASGSSGSIDTCPDPTVPRYSPSAAMSPFATSPSQSLPRARPGSAISPTSPPTSCGASSSSHIPISTT